MQIVEVTELAGVRTVVLRFRRAGGAVEFVLYPMIHLAEAAFYAEVTERVKECHLVVAEGVGRSIRTWALAAAHRLAKDTRRLGLVVQKIDYQAGGGRLITRDAGDLPHGVPPRMVLIPDLTAEEFRQGWTAAGMPLWWRALVMLLAPWYGLMIRLFGTRRAIAGRLDRDEISTRERRLGHHEHIAAMMRLLRDDRDRLLVAALRVIHERYACENVPVAVVWGAGHMSAAIQALWDLGYRPVAADWLTVFSLDG
jgi:hypothetical protein